MTLAADLTQVGYGPRPAQTLRWTHFWYAWWHAQTTRVRQEVAHNQMLLLANLLPHAGKESAGLQADLAAMAAATLAEFEAALYRELPLSARRLIDPPVTSAPPPQTEEEWWGQQIAEAPPGRRPFLEAGRRAHVARGPSPAA